MSEEKASGTSLCADISAQRVSSVSQSFDNQPGDQGLDAFDRWLEVQADDWCESGLCSSGSCKGFIRDKTSTLLSETEDKIEVKYSATIYCDCA